MQKCDRLKVIGIKYAFTLTAPHSCDYMGYVRHVGHAA